MNIGWGGLALASSGIISELLDKSDHHKKEKIEEGGASTVKSAAK